VEGIPPKKKCPKSSGIGIIGQFAQIFDFWGFVDWNISLLRKNAKKMQQLWG